MKVLITGASGLLGSSTARALIAQGHEVTTLQRRPSGVEGARDIQGSVTDIETVDRAVAGQDALIHMAAKVSMVGAPEEFEKVNIEGTANIVARAQQAGIGRMVHISSPSVAHSGDSLVGDGAGPADPEAARGEYARTKAAGERLALAASHDEFRVLALRPHLMWGPGEPQLTERIIDRAAQGRLPLLGSGLAMVDTLYIDNAVDAIVAALSAVEHTHGMALVVTNGQPRPIGELMRRIAVAGGSAEPTLRVPVGAAKVVGKVIEKVWTAGDFDDEPPITEFLAEQLSTAHWFDQRTTHSVLNWTPAVSIEEGLSRVAAHYGGTA